MRTKGIALFVAVLFSIIFLAPSAFAQKTITWKGQSFTPAGTIYHEWAVDWAKKIIKSSGGRLKGTMHSAGEIVPSSYGHGESKIVSGDAFGGEAEEKPAGICL